MQQHEGALRIDVEIAADLEGGRALNTVREERDYGEVVTDWQLAGVNVNENLRRQAPHFHRSGDSELFSGEAPISELSDRIRDRILRRDP
jgi:hypothetical protein